MSTTSTIGELLLDNAARDADAPAIVCPNTKALSFGDLERHVRRIGAQFHSAGLGARSRVGIALHFQRFLEARADVAICCTATVLPFNPNLPSAELQEELKRVHPDALVLPSIRPFPTG